MKTLASSPELSNDTPSRLIERAITARALGPANANRLLFASECGLILDDLVIDKIQEISETDESQFHSVTKYILPLLRVADDFHAGDSVRFQPPEKNASPNVHRVSTVTSKTPAFEDPMDSATQSLFDRNDFVAIDPGTELIHQEINVKWPGLVPVELSDCLKFVTEDRRTDSNARITSKFGIFYFRMSFFSDLINIDTPYKNAIYRTLRWHRLVPPVRLKNE